MSDPSRDRPTPAGSRVFERRARWVRRLVYSVCGLLMLWLVASVVWALAHSLNRGEATDPFTQEPVQFESDAP